MIWCLATFAVLVRSNFLFQDNTKLYFFEEKFIDYKYCTIASQCGIYIPNWTFTVQDFYSISCSLKLELSIFGRNIY